MLQPPVLMKGSDPSTALHRNSILQCKEKAEEEENGDNDSSTEDEFREEKVKSGERTHDGDDGSTLHRVELGPCTHLF